jgi:hypothetical protein
MQAVHCVGVTLIVSALLNKSPRVSDIKDCMVSSFWFVKCPKPKARAINTDLHLITFLAAHSRRLKTPRLFTFLTFVDSNELGAKSKESKRNLFMLPGKKRSLLYPATKDLCINLKLCMICPVWFDKVVWLGPFYIYLYYAVDTELPYFWNQR